MPKQQRNLKRDIEFLYEIGTLRFMQRTWIQFLQIQVADNADHIFRVMWIALTLARYENVKNEEKIIKMALLHDIAETRAPDTNYISKIYSTRDEDKAMHHMLDDTVFAKEFEELFKEYEERKSIESKIVKDADNLELLLTLKEQLDWGNSCAGERHWLHTTSLRVKSDSAKKLAEGIIATHADSWYVNKDDEEWLISRNSTKSSQS